MTVGDKPPLVVRFSAFCASAAWVAFFATIAFGSHWGRDSMVLLGVTVASTTIALVINARWLASGRSR